MGRHTELDGLHTLPELINNSIERFGDHEALREFDRKTNTWMSVDYETLGEQILLWRKAFAKLGLKAGDRVAILMPNCIDHVYADQAALANGLIPVPLHAIDTPGASAFITIDSQAICLITNKLNRWQQIKGTGVAMPDLKFVLITDPENNDQASDDGLTQVHLIPELLKTAESYTKDLPPSPKASDLASIVYTSGTTGSPKGVMLTHENIVSNLKATLEKVSPTETDVFLSFLPLSHTFERTVGYYLPTSMGCTIVYNRSILLLAEDLKTVRPTVIISVPRVYERIFARVRDSLNKASSFKRYMFNWAVEIGWRKFCRQNHLPIEKSCRSWLDNIIGQTILNNVSSLLLSQFGGRLRIAISGGAALNAQVARVFCGLGLPIIQGYGMTETSPIISGNCIEENQPHTVGRPFGEMEVRLADNGEIQLRGPSVMKGYWHRPDDTKASFTEDGWLKTGDIGEFNEQGLLQIKGRIKEIIVTSTGEKIPPADLELTIETDPLFAQTMVLGEMKPYLSLIAVVHPDEWTKLATSLGLDPADPEALNSPAAKVAALKRAKLAAKDFPNYALPRAIHLTTEPWTIENGLLTPTLKLKRGPLNAHFKQVIEKLYATHG